MLRGVIHRRVVWHLSRRGGLVGGRALAPHPKDKSLREGGHGQRVRLPWARVFCNIQFTRRSRPIGQKGQASR